MSEVLRNKYLISVLIVRSVDLLDFVRSVIDLVDL